MPSKTSERQFELPESLVRLHVVDLDDAVTRQLRELLKQLAGVPGCSLAVDLDGLDPKHDVTVLAMLVQTAREVAGNGGALLVVHPSQDLAVTLTHTGIRVVDGDGPPLTVGALTIELGSRVRAG